MNFHLPTRRSSRRREQGYVLLTLLLVIALGAIFAGAVASSIAFQIRRDREEEMIHRGVQYSRAVRAYYKKFGRYPTKIEDLESANNMRFLRKRYKDPLTGKDFKLLHFGDVKLTLSGGIGGGVIPGANPVGGSGGGLNGPTGFGQTGGGAQPSTFGGTSGGFGVNSNSSPGQNQNQQTTGNQTGSDSSQTGTQGSTDGTGANPSAPGTGTGNGASGDQLAGVTFGGGPIVGVASSSKKPTIREFNHKKKYDDWQFIYDPATDRGGLIMTPNQPALAGFGQQGMPNLNGQSGTSSGFGTSPTGMQNGPNPAPTGGFGNSTPQSNPPQQQQQQQ